jgi:hypothetical protein
MEFIVALILFVGMIVAWLIAPGSAPEAVSTPVMTAEPEVALQRAL